MSQRERPLQIFLKKNKQTRSTQKVKIKLQWSKECIITPFLLKFVITGFEVSWSSLRMEWITEVREEMRKKQFVLIA